MGVFLMALAKFGLILIVIALMVHLCVSMIVNYYFQEKKEYWMYMMAFAGKVMQEYNNAKNKEVKNSNESSSDRT